MSLPVGYDEEELEDALEQNITRFLLELGSGFAFIGRQKEIIVAGKTRKIDMLFYHIKLRCYVVVELIAVSFEPEFESFDPPPVFPPPGIVPWLLFSGN